MARSRRERVTSGVKVPIALKLAAFIAILVIACMIWQTYTATSEAQLRLEDEINRSGVLAAAAIGAALDPDWLGNPQQQEQLRQKLAELILRPGMSRVIDILAYNAAGQPLATATGKSSFGLAFERQVRFENAGEVPIRIDEYRYEGLPVRSFSYQLPVGRVDLYLSAHAIEESRQALAAAMTRVSIIASAVAALGAFVLAHLLTRPIRMLLRDMRQVSLGHLEHKSRVRTSDELGELARAFNDMTTELQAAQELKLSQKALEHELALATGIQTRLLPSELPHLPGFDLSKYYAPAREVGGDYYDFIPLENDSLGIAIADVSGKGIPAALVMTLTRSLLRMSAREESAPGPCLDRLNRSLSVDLNPGMFVTMAYVVLDPERREARLVRAGHNPPVFYSAKPGRVLRLHPRGLGIGIDREGSRFVAELQTQRFEFQPGDILVLYTDGIVEGKNSKSADYSEERLLQVLSANASGSAEEISQAIVADLARHCRGTEPSDDVTLIVLKANELTAPR